MRRPGPEIWAPEPPCNRRRSRRHMPDSYSPRPEHRFSFGLWTVGNRGRDPFGDAVRLLARVGAWGVSLHDNDLVPIDATAAERDRIVTGFKRACKDHGLVV